MSIIISKLIDGLTVNLLRTNDIPYVIFSYFLYDNYNVDTSTPDSGIYFVTYTPLSDFTYTYIQDKDDSDKYIQVTVECGAYTHIFNVGEYRTSNNSPLDLYDVVRDINLTLGW